MKELWALGSTLLIVIAYIPYLRDIKGGKTRPHLYTWFVSGFVTLLAFGLQVSNDGGWGSVPTFFAALAGLLVFAMSLRYKRAPITVSDTLFFIFALLATGLWLIADRPVLSALLITAINIFAFLPTVRKSWRQPYQETVATYGINTLRFSLSVLAIQSYTIVTALYPLSSVLVNGFIAGFLIVRRYSLRK